MKLTPQQLHIMQRAKKDLTFGCIYTNGTMRLNGEYARYSGVHQRDSEDKDIAGHPLDRGRLLYFIHKDGEYIRKNGGDGYFLDYADKHREVFNQTVLERHTEFCTLVEKFLESLPPDTTTEGA